MLFVFQQLTTTQVKVDKVQVSGTCNTTFAVCLDQDEKKILQSVTRYSLFLLAIYAKVWLKRKYMYFLPSSGR